MTEKKQKALVAFKKAQGQINKVIKMTEDGNYCIDVMQQNLAAIGLLKSAHQLLLENHLDTCFKDSSRMKNGKNLEKMVGELLSVIRLYNK